MTITGAQCHAARILCRVKRSTLALRTGLAPDAVAAFEAGLRTVDEGTSATLRAALEELGIEFIPESDGRGMGVRLKFDRAQTRQIDGWESEGGFPADDDVP